MAADIIKNLDGKVIELTDIEKSSDSGGIARTRQTSVRYRSSASPSGQPERPLTPKQPGQAGRRGRRTLP